MRSVRRSVVVAAATASCRGYRSKYDPKPDDHDFNLRKQRIQSFRWLDRNNIKPHRKYDIDPTRWNREAAEEQRRGRTAQVLVQQALSRDIAGPRELDDRERSQHEPLTANDTAQVGAIIGARGVAAWMATRRHLRTLRDPARRHSPVATEALKMRIAATVPPLLDAIQRLPTAADLAALDSLSTALPFAELVSDLRLVLNASGASAPERARFTHFAEAVAHAVCRVANEAADREASAQALQALGLVALVSATTAAVLGTAKRVHGAGAVPMPCAALEQFTAALVVPGTATQFGGWLATCVESSINDWVKETKRRDATFAWGTIEEGKSTPVPPAVPRQLCNATRAVIANAADELGAARFVKAVTRLAELLQFTPNHALPVAQVVAVAHTCSCVADVLGEGDAAVVHAWVEILSRLGGRTSLLSADGLQQLFDTLTADAFVSEAARDREAGAQHGHALRHCLGGMASLIASATEHKAPLAEAVAMRLAALGLKAPAALWEQCLAAFQQRSDDLADGEGAVLNLWVLRARRTRGDCGTESYDDSLLTLSCSVLKTDQEALGRKLHDAAVARGLAAHADAVADDVHELMSHL
jgi:hypothetical protein